MGVFGCRADQIAHHPRMTTAAQCLGTDIDSMSAGRDSMCITSRFDALKDCGAQLDTQDIERRGAKNAGKSKRVVFYCFSTKRHIAQSQFKITQLYLLANRFGIRCKGKIAFIHEAPVSL